MENIELLEWITVETKEVTEPTQDQLTRTDEDLSMSTLYIDDEKDEEIDEMAIGVPSTSGRMRSKSPRKSEQMDEMKTPMQKSRGRSKSRVRTQGNAAPKSRSTSRTRSQRGQKGPAKVSRGRSSSKSRFNSSLHPRDATGRFVSKNRHAC